MLLKIITRYPSTKTLLNQLHFNDEKANCVPENSRLQLSISKTRTKSYSHVKCKALSNKGQTLSCTCSTF